MTDAKIRAEDVAYVDRLREIIASAHAVRCTCGDKPWRRHTGDAFDIRDPRCVEIQALATQGPPPNYPIIHGRPHDARTAWDHE